MLNYSSIIKINIGIILKVKFMNTKYLLIINIKTKYNKLI
jgi:hypothetical protein